MTIAPVIIPTLNRYKHLKQCIESLQNNLLAKDTELFISVDFPPNEKYMEGYKKVKAYVENEISGFKKVHSFFQKQNLGVSKNSGFLRDEVRKEFDAYIYTEDDNVFSPGFLSYINQCLNKYKDDEMVNAISGYSYPIEWNVDKDSIIMCNCLFPAWGYATWFDKRDQFMSFSKEDIQIYLKKFANARNLYRRNRHLFIEAVHIARNNHYLALDEQKKLRHIDCVMGIYLIMKNIYAIIPAVSMVRNMGYDGSGLHCAEISKGGRVTATEYDFSNQPMDERTDFELEKKNVIFINADQQKKLDLFMENSAKEHIKAWILWFLFRLNLI